MLRRGSVIWAKANDPDGNPIYDEQGNLKEHPCLVLSRQERIDAGATLAVAVISTKFDDNHIPPNWFRMPYHRAGHPSTGLYKPCVVKADWLINIDDRDDILRESPGVADKATRLVLEWLKSQGKI